MEKNHKSTDYKTLDFSEDGYIGNTYIHSSEGINLMVKALAENFKMKCLEKINLKERGTSV